MRINIKKIFNFLILPIAIFSSSCFNFSCTEQKKDSKPSSDKFVAITPLEDDTTINLELNGNCQPDLQISYTGEHWDKYNFDKPISLNKNQILYLRGSNKDGWSKSNSEYAKFSINKPVDLSGYLKYLINYNLDSTSNCPITDYCFYKLFDSCKISSLPQDFLSSFSAMKNYCFSQMFKDSTISTIPNLIATQFAPYCYQQMFFNCLSINKVDFNSSFKNIKNLSSGCFQEMFANCKNLENVTGSIDVNYLDDYACASMFSGCEKLVNSLMITFRQDYKLGKNCFEKMFLNCKSLITSSFKNIQLSSKFVNNFNMSYACDKCFSQTFYGCKSLRILESGDSEQQGVKLISIPNDIKLTTTNSPFLKMFYGCTTSGFLNHATYEVVPGKTYYCLNSNNI